MRYHQKNPSIVNLIAIKQNQLASFRYDWCTCWRCENEVERLLRDCLKLHRELNAKRVAA